MDEITNDIEAFQKKLIKYKTNHEEKKLIYYLGKLRHLPIKVSHLEQTGVGRSVNALRHHEGTVGERARNLVSTWRKMVSAEENTVQQPPLPYKAKEDSTPPASPKKEQETHQSPDEYDDDDDDCERLQIEEAGCDQSEDEAMSADIYDPHKSLHDFKTPTTNGGGLQHNKYTAAPSSKYSLPASCSDSSDLSPKYNPYTSTQDYESISAHHSDTRIEYQPTAILAPSSNASPDRSGDEEERLSSSSNNKNKSKHKDKSKEKKHKSQSKERDHKSKHSHKSSVREKDKTHKDIRKDKERSNSKKCSNRSEKLSDNESSVDGRSLNTSKAVNVNKSSRSAELDCSVVNGHDSVDSSDRTHKKSSSSNNSSNKSNSRSESSKSNSKSSSSSHKDKKDKKRGRENSAKSNDDHKCKKRKDDDNEGFGAALMGLESTQSPSKKKKSKENHRSKEHRSHKSKNSSTSNNSNSSSSSQNDQSNHSSKASTSKTSKIDEDIYVVPPAEAVSPAVDVLPDIDPNYKPLPRVPLPDVLLDDDLSLYPSYLPTFEPKQEQKLTQQETLDKIMSSKGKSKRQIYSGKANVVVCSEVPSLFNLTVRCLQENIESLEYTGGIPYDVLKPVIERTTPTQLFNLENFNPYLLEDTNQLWEQHCKKEFKSKVPEEMETYRDMYMRMTDERNQKFKSLTQNLANKFETKLPSRRTTQLAFEGTIAKPPKSVARAQARFGTGVAVGTPARTTKAAEVIARKQAMVNVQRNERSAAAAGRSAGSARKPKAPLMAKTMQFYKKHTFRR